MKRRLRPPQAPTPRDLVLELLGLDGITPGELAAVLLAALGIMLLVGAVGVYFIGELFGGWGSGPSWRALLSPELWAFGAVVGGLIWLVYQVYRAFAAAAKAAQPRPRRTRRRP